MTESRCIVQFISVSVVMFVGWHVRYGVRWCMCVGVSQLSASLVVNIHVNVWIEQPNIVWSTRLRQFAETCDS